MSSNLREVRRWTGDRLLSVSVISHAIDASVHDICQCVNFYSISLLSFLRPSRSMNGSVRLSAPHTFSLCSPHRIIMKFSVITNDRSDVHAKGQGSKVNVTEVKTKFSGFRTVTPVWIHIWCWNDVHSLMLLRRGALLFFNEICQMSGSHG